VVQRLANHSVVQVVGALVAAGSRTAIHTSSPSAAAAPRSRATPGSRGEAAVVAQVFEVDPVLLVLVMLGEQVGGAYQGRVRPLLCGRAHALGGAPVLLVSGLRARRQVLAKLSPAGPAGEGIADHGGLDVTGVLNVESTPDSRPFRRHFLRAEIARVKDRLGGVCADRLLVASAARPQRSLGRAERASLKMLRETVPPGAMAMRAKSPSSAISDRLISTPDAAKVGSTTLRFIGRRVVPHLYPADLPLPRGRAKEPCGGPSRYRRSRTPAGPSCSDPAPCRCPSTP
jgi:hypothetical protein